MQIIHDDRYRSLFILQMPRVKREQVMSVRKGIDWAPRTCSSLPLRSNLALVHLCARLSKRKGLHGWRVKLRRSGIQQPIARRTDRRGLLLVVSLRQGRGSSVRNGGLSGSLQYAAACWHGNNYWALPLACPVLSCLINLMAGWLAVAAADDDYFR